MPSLRPTVLLLAALPVTLAAQSKAKTIQLGAATASVKESFDAISGVRELPDGRVVLSDGIAEQVYVVNPRTGARSPIGRKGAGPGEYRLPDMLFAWPGDSTLLVDLGNTRLSILAPGGAVGRTTRLTMEGTGPGGMTIVFPQATDQRGRVYFRPGGLPTADSAAVVRWTPGATTFDSVTRIALPPRKVTTTGGANNRGQTIRPIPYGPQDGWAVGSDGALFVVRSADYHMEWVLPGGRAVRGSPVAWTPVPIREKDKQAWADQLASTGLLVSMEVGSNGQRNVTLGRGGGRRDEDLNAYEWPATKPAFRAGGVSVSPTGEGWVERYGPAGEPLTYDVFGRDGALLRRVVLPADRRLVAFGKGTLYLARTDADGLQWLERYAYPM